jgi:hypothetical protein
MLKTATLTYYIGTKIEELKKNIAGLNRRGIFNSRTHFLKT